MLPVYVLGTILLLPDLKYVMMNLFGIIKSLGAFHRSIIKEQLLTMLKCFLSLNSQAVGLQIIVTSFFSCIFMKLYAKNGI